jgi:hypothetical protein
MEFFGVRILGLNLATFHMELGVPPLLYPAPHHWVEARQYTGPWE